MYYVAIRSRDNEEDERYSRDTAGDIGAVDDCLSLARDQREIGISEILDILENFIHSICYINL